MGRQASFIQLMATLVAGQSEPVRKRKDTRSKRERKDTRTGTRTRKDRTGKDTRKRERRRKDRRKRERRKDSRKQVDELAAAQARAAMTAAGGSTGSGGDD